MNRGGIFLDWLALIALFVLQITGVEFELVKRKGELTIKLKFGRKPKS
jgi:hypothetical protein